ncbi:MAG: BppU family phage baseplate upper protein [Clostridia bacterium]
MTDVSLQLNAWTENPGNEVFCVQGEQNSRTLSITLIDRTGNESGPLAVAKQTPRYLDLTGYTARMYVEKKDETAVYFDGTVTDAKNGKVEFTLPAQAVTLSGNVPCTIELSNGTAELKVIGIILNVQKSNLEDSVESSDDFSTLQTVIERAETAIEECESAAEGVTEAKEEAHTNALAAATAASLANQKAQDAEEAASNAQTQALAAQSGAAAANSAASAANTAADRANEAAEAVEGLDVSQLVQQIQQLMPQSVRFWRCEDGQNYLELWAVAQADIVWYYAVIAGLGGLSDSYTTDDGELTDLKTLGSQYLPAVTHDGSTPAVDNYNATFIASGGHNASISARLTLLNMAGTDMTDIAINTNGDTTSYLVTPGVICLGCCKNLRG